MPRRPPGRHRRGRHRKPKSSGAPVYVTTATLAAFVVGGVNVPGAIGASRQPRAHADTHERSGQQLAALELRSRNAAAEDARISRVRSEAAAALLQAREQARRARAEAKRRARAAALRALKRWVSPILNYHLSAGFGESSYLWSSVHTGQDFSAPVGTPVRAAAAGTIIFAGWDGAYGNKIAIQHHDGTVTWYAHLSAFVLTTGEVAAGDMIGRVGSTGNTTGAHLHFEVRPGGDKAEPIDPLGWLRAHGVHV